MSNLEDYRKVAGDKVIEEIYRKAKKFTGKRVVCISSSHQGGGVAEMLNSIVFIFNEVGIKFGWRIIQGSPDFFTITKSFHNALQGERIGLSVEKKKTYLRINERFSIFTHLNHDLVIVHDPQPLALIDFKRNKQPWIFRCHIDLSQPDKRTWNYLKGFIEKYDHAIVSTEEYKKKLSIPQSIICPAIDPLSPKNKQMSKKQIDRYLKLHKIDAARPIICQISRFDKWKDPIGVIKVFEKVRKKIDCQLVLLGNIAMDDPEGIEIYKNIINKYGKNSDIKILIDVDDNDLVVNALQTRSSVIIQKSLKEGFGLTIAEALYKGTPVVASNIGGIPLQLENGVSGFLHDPKDIKGFSNSVIKILQDEKLRKQLGKNGKKHIKDNFLITRIILDWLNIFEKYLK